MNRTEVIGGFSWKNAIIPLPKKRRKEPDVIEDSEGKIFQGNN